MTEFAEMYGGSLYELASAEGLDDSILADLDEATRLIGSEAEYMRLLSTPSLPKSERCGLLDEAFRGSVHAYVLNFLKMLCENGHLRQLKECARAYRVRYNAAHGILEAAAVSAVPLSDEQAERLRKKLESLTGKQVRLTRRVEPNVLGGIRLDMDGTEFDGTVQNRLAGLRRSIASATI